MAELNRDDFKQKVDLFLPNNSNRLITESKVRELFKDVIDSVLNLVDDNIEVDWANINGKPSSFPPEGHVHSIANITDLTDILASKADNDDARFHIHSNKSLLDTYTQTNSNLADAVSKKHTQNTDSGTNILSFIIGEGNADPVRLKNSSGVLHLRNAADSDFVDLVAGDALLNKITYSADDSANYNSRSVPDVGWVNSQLTIGLATKADLVGGVIPTAQIPAVAISEFIGTKASEAEMLAVTGYQKGDWCIRTDDNKTYILIADTPANLSSWQAISYPLSSVLSVNGQVGVIVLGKADVGLGNVDNTTDLGKPISTATQSALDLKDAILSFSNGLTRSVNNVLLGGALNQSTNITGSAGLYNLTLGGTTGNQQTGKLNAFQVSSVTGQLGFWNTNSFRKSQIDWGDNSIALGTTVGTGGLNSSTNAQFTMASGTIGLKSRNATTVVAGVTLSALGALTYDADYSSIFTARSLVDVGYVAAQFTYLNPYTYTWSRICRLATTANVALNNVGSTIDGVSLPSTGCWVLLKNQTNSYQNGVYYVFDVGGGVYQANNKQPVYFGTFFYVIQGSTNANKLFRVTNSNNVDAATAISGASGLNGTSDTCTITEFTGGGLYTNGSGLGLSGNTFTLGGTISANTNFDGNFNVWFGQTTRIANYLVNVASSGIIQLGGNTINASPSLKLDNTRALLANVDTLTGYAGSGTIGSYVNVESTGLYLYNKNTTSYQSSIVLSSASDPNILFTLNKYNGVTTDLFQVTFNDTGLLYGSDFSADWTDRNIPDVGWVNSSLAGVLSPSQIEFKAQSKASASTITLASGDGQVVSVTGTATVNTISAAWFAGNSILLTIIPKGVFRINHHTIGSGNIRTISGRAITTVVDEPILFIWDGATSKWLQTKLLSSEFKKTKNQRFGSHFADTNNIAPWVFSGGASGGVLGVASLEAGEWGIVTVSKGTGNGSSYRGRLGLGTSGGNLDWWNVGGKFGFASYNRLRIPTLSTATDTINVLVGWNSSLTAEGSNCIMFKHSNTGSTPNWMILVKKAGSTTVNNFDTGVPVVANQMYELDILISPDGSEVEFYIDNVLRHTVTGTSNIPNGTGESMGLFATQLFCSAGTADRLVHCDYGFYDFL